MPNYEKVRDLWLRAIQVSIAKASIPAFGIVDALHTKKPITKQEQVNLATDTCSILATANTNLNQLGLELVKPSLQKKHQVLCNKPLSGATKYLFGEDLHEHVEAANTSSSLLARTGGVVGEAT